MINSFVVLSGTISFDSGTCLVWFNHLEFTQQESINNFYVFTFLNKIECISSTIHYSPQLTVRNRI